MNKGKRKKRVRRQAQKAFVRGFVATALIANLDRPAGTRGGLARDSMRRALMGGVAIASGTVVAEGLLDREYLKSMMALAVGAVGMAVVGRRPASDETAQVDHSSVEEEIGQVQR